MLAKKEERKKEERRKKEMKWKKRERGMEPNFDSRLTTYE